MGKVGGSWTRGPCNSIVDGERVAEIRGYLPVRLIEDAVRPAKGG